MSFLFSESMFFMLQIVPLHIGSVVNDRQGKERDT